MTKTKLNYITKALYNDVKKEDVLVLKDGKLCLNGKPISDETKKSLANQAQTIMTMDVYKLLMDEMRVLSNKKIYYDSKTEYDIMFAKAILWTIDVLEKKLANISKL
jgi:hypothetical protein